MRKNKIMRAASGLLVATLLTTSVISGTFAKYTSSASGSDQARVAKWSFKVKDTDIVSSRSYTFDLFKTVNGYDDTTDDAEVKNGTDENIIAPGTSGSFALELKNESEVTAKYAIDFTETNASQVPIEYSTNKTDWKSSINDLNIAADDTETALAYTDGTKTITVYWRWAYEAAQTPVRNQSDSNDTALGIAGTGTVSVKADITATQVD